MKKTTLKVNSIATMCLFWIAAFLPLLLILSSAIFGTSDDSSVETVLLSILWIAISVCLIIFALYSIQRAEISEEGITIYSVVFSTIKVIKWNELIDVRTMEPISRYSSYHSPMIEDWIVLYTDPSQEEKWHSMVNRKKAGPWYITCKKENITVLTEYIIKYAPHICDDPDVFL